MLETLRGYGRLPLSGDALAPAARTRSRIVLGAATAILLSLIALGQHLRPYHLPQSRELLGLRPMAAGLTPICNPLLEPGRVLWDPRGDNWRTRWQRFGASACPDAPDWFSLLRDAADPADAMASPRAAAIPELAWLRDKTILLIGGTSSICE